MLNPRLKNSLKAAELVSVLYLHGGTSNFLPEDFKFTRLDEYI